MTASDTTATNPRYDGNKMADPTDDTGKPYQISEPQVSEPQTVPAASPGPDTREEPYAPK